MQFTPAELWHHMGLFARGIVLVMLAMSLGSVVVMVERLVYFARARRGSQRFAQAVAARLAQGDLVGASEQSPGEGGYLGRLVHAGLAAWKTTTHVPPDLAVESVARALERASARELQTFKRGLGLLATVGSTAPFVGLLGTVMGIVTAFQEMAKSGSGGLATVSAGIAEALVTTAIGLLVAIPAVMAYNYLQGWIDARATDLSESANELLDVVARNRQG